MTRQTTELGRQLFHMLLGAIIILLLLFISREIMLIVLFLLFLVSVLFSILSLKLKIPILTSILALMEREEDVKRFPGKGFVFFVAGSLLVLKFFPQNIALAAIVVLTFGDSLSTLAGFFGQKYSHKPFSRFKTLYGTLIGIIVSFFIALIFVEPILAAVASVFGMFAEALSIKLGETEADDNLIVPLAAGTACYLAKLMLA